LRKNKYLAAALAVCMMLTACQGGIGQQIAEKGGALLGQGGENKPETLPESKEYVSENGLYSVTMLEGFQQDEMTIQTNFSMMGLDSTEDGPNLSCVALGGAKTGVPGKQGGLNSLEEYGDHVSEMLQSDNKITFNWETKEDLAMDGMTRGLAWEGDVSFSSSKGKAYSIYGETEGGYYALIVMGASSDVEDAKKVMSIKELENAVTLGTKDFLFAMTAVLDSVNGGSAFQTAKMAEDSGIDAGQIATGAKNSLSGSWGVEDKASLEETKEWLLTEGHNLDAMELLSQEYGISTEVSREELEEKTNGDDNQNSLLAAYDARAAFGEAGIKAWDLSRVGTIMGFGYAAGYCTYEEALDGMLEAAQIAKESFGSWDEFNKSYLLGYAYWSEESLEDPESSASERASIIKELEAQANGPFSVDWSMELKKDW
jgi:hypothetical protein